MEKQDNLEHDHLSRQPGIIYQIVAGLFTIVYHRFPACLHLLGRLIQGDNVHFSIRGV
jgi:hypothetical protein